MAKLTELLIWSPKIEPTVARLTVVASCEEPVEGMRLRGSLQGPTCTYAKTVEGETALVPQPVTAGIDGEGTVQAEAQVMEPCLWEPEHPFLYQMQLELCHGEGKLDEWTLSVGIRHLGCDEQGFCLNGRRLRLTAASVADSANLSEQSLEAWHRVGWVAVEADYINNAVLHRTDRMGVFLIVNLPDDLDAAEDGANVARMTEWRLHPSVALWTVGCEQHVAAVRALDPTRPIAMRTSPGSLPQKTEAHLLAVAGSASEMADVASRASKPLLALSKDATLQDADAFHDALAARQEQLAGVPNLAGIIV